MPSLRPNDVYGDNFDLFLPLFLLFSVRIHKDFYPPLSLLLALKKPSLRICGQSLIPHPRSDNTLSLSPVCHLNISNDPKCDPSSVAI